MGWSRQQNPTGVNNPAVQPIQADPLDLTTTKKDQRKLDRAKTGHTVPGGDSEPIAASSRKTDGFAPAATGPLA